MSDRRVLVFGGSGLLGRHLVERGESSGWDVHATHHQSPPPACRQTYCGDLVDALFIASTVEAAAPTHIINAAYVQSGPNVNEVCALAPESMAIAARNVGAKFVHVSTDLVFDGTLGRPYREDDPTSPLTEYGRAKVDSERRVLGLGTGSVVARTSLIYGEATAPQETLVRRAHDDGDIAFFTDEWRTAVHVADLAAALFDLATTEVTGLLHVAGSERLNRLEFAQVLARALGLDADRLAGRTQDPALGPRPADVSLDTTVVQELGLDLPGPTSRLTSGYR